MKNKLVLIDGNSIAYRAFFALPLLSTNKGIYTNAVYGFTTMLLKVLEEEKPTHLLVAFDAGKTTFRHKNYQDYKGGRQKTPSELSEQFPFIRELLDAFNIPRYELEQYEADDIIGTLSKKAEEEDWEVKVFSGDKDLLQLVSDHVTVAVTKKGITDVDTYNIEALHEKYGLSPNQIIDMKALMGDKSDNIPGVPGVGEKTALKLLHEFGTVDKVLESIDQISGKKMKERLKENRDQALMSKELVTILRETPVEISISDLQLSEYNKQKVSDLFKELEFKSLLGKFSDDRLEEQETFDEEINYEIIEEITPEMLVSPTALVVEVNDENYHNAPIQGIGLVNEKGRFYISTEKALTSDCFKEWAKDSEQEKLTFDAKRAIVSLGWHEVDLEGVNFDLLIASYLLNPAESSHDVADIANRRGYANVQHDEVVYGKGAKRKIPEEDILSEHLIRKADALFHLYEQVSEELKENSQYELFSELEMPLSVVLGKMERQGVEVDVNRLENMGKELDEKLQRLGKEIHELAGVEFNVNSPKQLGEILFEKLQLPVVKKTKTGYSTSADVLEKLADKHEIIPKILDYRQLGKLYSTYIEGLLKVVDKESNKIHTRFNQAITQTGRLSSTDPNLQNIPIRLEEGRKIRQAFIPSQDDWVIFAADYSQIELRVLAHIAKDEKLTAAFNQGMDIHTKTAMDVFGAKEEEVTADMRRHAKAVNFGIVYGISDYGLSQSLGITRKEAAAFIERYLESFPGVKAYMDDIIQQAKRDGFVTTLLNRRRYLPEINSRNFNLRSFAERTAMNTPIQGTAADIIKLAMVEMTKRLELEGLETKMLLQVHDELIFETPKHEVDLLKNIVPEVMESALLLDVPLKVDYSYGSTWYDAK